MHTGEILQKEVKGGKINRLRKVLDKIYFFGLAPLSIGIIVFWLIKITNVNFQQGFSSNCADYGPVSSGPKLKKLEGSF